MQSTNREKSPDIRSEVESVLGVQLAKEPKNKRIRLIGFAIVALFLGGMTLWSTLAPIDSATLAQGKLTVRGDRRTVQALESGKIAKILVKENDTVKRGQLLVQLDRTRAASQYTATERQYFNALAMENRLVAERDDSASIHFDHELTDAAAKNPRFQKLIAAQNALFTSTRKANESTIAILNQQIAQTNEQINGVEAQLHSVTQQHQLIEKEIVPTKKLLKQQLIEESKLLQLQRQAAQLSGLRGEHLAKIAELKQRVSEVKAKMASFGVDEKKKVLTELRQTQQQLGELRKRRVVEKDILDNTEIRSPQSGSVVGTTR